MIFASIVKVEEKLYFCIKRGKNIMHFAFVVGQIFLLEKILVAVYVEGTSFNKIRKLFEKKVCEIPALQSISMARH